MRDILEYCIGGIRRNVTAGTEVLHEGGRTGHLYVLIEGRLEVVKGDTVVATVNEPGAVVGEMSVLLGQPHTASGVDEHGLGPPAPVDRGIAPAARALVQLAVLDEEKRARHDGRDFPVGREVPPPRRLEEIASVGALDREPCFGRLAVGR